MLKYRFIITLLYFLMQSGLQAGTYECTYTKRNQKITQDELTSTKRDQCLTLYGSGCSCKRMATKCTFGPDSKGDFIIDQVVPDGRAANCDRDFCICTSHEAYHETVAHRLENAENKLKKPTKSDKDETVNQEEPGNDGATGDESTDAVPAEQNDEDTDSSKETEAKDSGATGQEGEGPD